MKDFNTIDEILDFAIQNEQNAVDFYTGLAEKSEAQEVKEILIDFAKEEINHKSRLLAIKEEGVFAAELYDVVDLQISDFLIKMEPTPEMTYQDTLVLAMHREKAAFKMYNKLAQKTLNQDLKAIFLNLAQEEAKHKLRFELEYDEFILREN